MWYNLSIKTKIHKKREKRIFIFSKLFLYFFEYFLNPTKFYLIIKK